MDNQYLVSIKTANQALELAAMIDMELGESTWTFRREVFDHTHTVVRVNRYNETEGGFPLYKIEYPTSKRYGDPTDGKVQVCLVSPQAKEKITPNILTRLEKIIASPD